MPESKSITAPSLKELGDFAEEGLKAAQGRLFGKDESRHYSEEDRANFEAKRERMQQLIDALRRGPRIVIEIGDGALSGVISDIPVDVLVLDYDVEVMDDGALISVPNNAGDAVAAQAIHMPAAHRDTDKDKARLSALFDAYERDEPPPRYRP